MAKQTATPSESEWQVMEIFWESDTPLTSSEVIKRLSKSVSMTPRMVRVLINRLCEKGLLSYTVDGKDKRVYHYFVMKSKEECQKEKSRRFVDSYFEGSQKNAMAALLQNAKLTEEQLRELEEILEQCREVEAPGKKERDRE